MLYRGLRRGARILDFSVLRAQGATAMEPSKWLVIGGSDPGFLGWMEHVLREEGYRVAAAAEEDALLTLSARLQPVAVLLAASDSGLDAWNLQRQFRSGAGTQNVPVILIGE